MEFGNTDVMRFVTGSSKLAWQPVMTADTTIPSYWLNWRVAICAVWISFCMIVASFMIWRYEGSNDSSSEGDQQEVKRSLYADETWKPCLKEIHPAWLLVYRVTAFILLLALLIANAVVDSGGIFYFYTQWTFTLVTVYFGLGSMFSSYGCVQFSNRVGGDRMGPDAEQGNIARPLEGNANQCNLDKISALQEQSDVHQLAGTWGYIFQVIFQVNAGAVLLTDFVFWFIIFPFLEIKDYKLNFFLVVMHSINAVVLLGETTLNCLRFPWFRIAYFMLWTCAFVIFQWVVHACVAIWWPYPFLDLSSHYAPIWYLVVGLMHIPCYAIFASMLKLKHYLWSRWFPHSYQCRG